MGEGATGTGREGEMEARQGHNTQFGCFPKCNEKSLHDWIDVLKGHS